MYRSVRRLAGQLREKEQEVHTLQGQLARLEQEKDLWQERCLMWETTYEQVVGQEAGAWFD